ncbi:unnamed protein product [Pylaiella littoralis]
MSQRVVECPWSWSGVVDAARGGDFTVGSSDVSSGAKSWGRYLWMASSYYGCRQHCIGCWLAGIKAMTGWAFFILRRPLRLFLLMYIIILFLSSLCSAFRLFS